MKLETIKKYFKYYPLKLSYNVVGMCDLNKQTFFKYYNTLSKGIKIEVDDKFYINENEILKYINLQFMLNTCKFKINSVDRSIKLFGRGAQKKRIVGKIFEGIEILLDTEVKKSDELESSIYLKTEFGNLRFSLDDVKIIYPNFNGFNPKKDRNIYKGDIVRVINDKHCKNIKKNDKVKVYELRSVGNKIYAGIKINNELNYIRTNCLKK